jgi:hypothetical protein
MIGNEAVPPAMLGGVRSPENQGGPPWSLRKPGWICAHYIDTAGASVLWPGVSGSLARDRVTRILAYERM